MTESTTPNKSTNVRTRPDPLARVRPAMRLLSTVSPSAAAAVAERLMTTPFRHPRPDREALLLQDAERFDVPFGDGRLAAWRWGEGPTVVLVHGWSGRGAQLAALVPTLVASGHRVVAFDAPGHGESSGKSLSLADFAAAIEEVVWACGPVHAIVAHSFGAMATSLALRNGLPVRRLTYVGGAAWTEQSSELMATAFGISPGAMARLRRRLERRTGVQWQDLLVERLAADRSEELLLVHDRGDREVGVERARLLQAAWAGARLLETEGLGHYRILRDPGVVEAIAEFVTGAAGASDAAPPRVWGSVSA